VHFVERPDWHKLVLVGEVVTIEEVDAVAIDVPGEEIHSIGVDDVALGYFGPVELGDLWLSLPVELREVHG
jgi:hypothetical protein